MKLRQFALGAALGATVLTAVPAMVAPQEAAAGCWGEYYSDCQPDNPTDPGDWGGGGDTGGGDWGGGDTGGGGGGGETGAIDFSDGNVGDYAAGIPTVVITGTSYVFPAWPADPEEPSVEWNSGGGGGGGGGGGDSAYPIRPMSAKTNIRQNCVKNNGVVPMKATESSKYQVSYKVSANISAAATQALNASLGVEINKSFEKTTGFEVTLNPGESWGLDVEYQTVEWAITTTAWTGKTTTEYVNVTQPTNTVTAVRCD
ncbi:DUF6426 family protein [Streptomyces sp. NPDC097704]|uniref:DUF6426 family protein n=1 Tax=Streptomyces sp. NPDC097704 TaxID=3157101 RepID=UPI00332F5A1C